MSKIGLEPARHEASDVSARFVWAGAATATLAVMFFAALVLWLFPGSLLDRTLHLPISPYPAPALQTDPAADMARLYNEEMAQLNSTGWIDQSAGRAHIPITQAMRLVAKEGIRGWPRPPEEAPLAQPPAEKAPSGGVAASKSQEKLNEAHRRNHGARRPGAGRRCAAGARYCRRRL
ncbi:hypothetical protein ACNHKD_01620 [Methylocystis sp. JAN1]|uniref:hypothetical protein n=1 Tax=Methylocystis sp. JAN1 TaxID=3397211 RepID=UPI003FA2465D